MPTTFTCASASAGPPGTPPAVPTTPPRASTIDQLEQQHGSEDARDDPRPGTHPLPLLRLLLPPGIDQHHREEEQHHDRAGVDDHLESGDEGRAEDVEDQSQSQERHHQVEQRMDGLASG